MYIKYVLVYYRLSSCNTMKYGKIMVIDLYCTCMCMYGDAVSIDPSFFLLQLIRELKEEVSKLRDIITSEGLEAQVANFGEYDHKCTHAHTHARSQVHRVSLMH